MAITDKSRKLLWGRAANRCALCRIELVLSQSDADEESVVGEECHIAARSSGGPRYRHLSLQETDAYKNLILLCRNHHKLVDDQPETFSEAILHRLKANHERWVAGSLGRAPRESTSTRTPVQLLTDGSAVLGLVASANAYDFDHDPLDDEDEVALVGGFLQSVHDWGDIWDDMESAGHVEARFHLGKELKELRAQGFLVYGGSRTQAMLAAGKPITLRVAMLRVLRENNPRVPERHRGAD